MTCMRYALGAALVTAGCLIGDACGDTAGNAAETKCARLWRSDDQMRFLWATVDPILPDLVKQGFNTVITSTGVAYDLEKDAPVPNMDKFCAKRKAP